MDHSNPFGDFQFGAFMVIMCIALAIGIAIAVVICLLLSGCYSRIPKQFRKQEPGMVWLLLIPCFSMIWNFFVFPQLADSYKAYFNSIGRTDVGDCGRSIGMWYAICVVGSIIPCLGYIAGAASLVLLIIYLVKAMGLKNQIPAQGGN